MHSRLNLMSACVQNSARISQIVPKQTGKHPISLLLIAVVLTSGRSIVQCSPLAVLSAFPTMLKLSFEHCFLVHHQDSLTNFLSFCLLQSLCQPCFESVGFCFSTSSGVRLDHFVNNDNISFDFLPFGL